MSKGADEAWRKLGVEPQRPTALFTKTCFSASGTLFLKKHIKILIEKKVYFLFGGRKMVSDKTKIFLALVVLGLGVLPLFAVEVNAAHPSYSELPVQITDIEHLPVYLKTPSGGEMWFKVTWVVRGTPTRWTPTSIQTRYVTVTVTVYDAVNVPIAFGYISNYYNPGTYSNTFRFPIPTWTFVGKATMYANIYSNGIIAPEVSSTFMILKA